MEGISKPGGLMEPMNRDFPRNADNAKLLVKVVGLLTSSCPCHDCNHDMNAEQWVIQSAAPRRITSPTKSH